MISAADSQKRDQTWRSVFRREEKLGIFQATATTIVQVDHLKHQRDVKRPINCLVSRITTSPAKTLGLVGDLKWYLERRNGVLGVKITWDIRGASTSIEVLLTSASDSLITSSRTRALPTRPSISKADVQYRPRFPRWEDHIAGERSNHYSGRVPLLSPEALKGKAWHDFVL